MLHRVPHDECRHALRRKGPLQVQQLVEMGADAGARDKRGVGALHYACGQGRLEVVKFLWSKGLDLDAEDPGAHPVVACWATTSM